MIELMSGVLFGIAAHQTDRIVKNWPHQWEYLSRYGIGYLTCGFTFVLIIKKLNPGIIKDAILAFGGAGFSTGLGVLIARLYDEYIK
jgi:hypothetical protein